MLCVVGWRMVSGRGRRSDGGLLPPVMLVVGGLVFMFLGLVTAFFAKWRGILLGLMWIIMSVACFSLARYRRRVARNHVNSDDVA
jgi:heme O synthase-like polyprenyltransferase